MQVRTVLLATTFGISLMLAGTGATFAHGPGPGMMMEPGQGPMMGHGQGRMMQPGAGSMEQGRGMMIRPHMMHHGMMGQGHGMMMSPHMMRRGMMGQGVQPGEMGGFHKLLSADDVKTHLDKWLAAHLGELAWSEGDQDAATTIWMDALEGNPDNRVLNEPINRFMN